MTDIGTAEIPTVGDPGPPAAPTPPPVTDVDSGPEFDALPEKTQAEIRRLRSEAAEYRTKANRFKVLDEIDEGNAKALLDLASLIQTGDAATVAQYMVGQSRALVEPDRWDALLAASAPQPAAAPPAPIDPLTATPEQLQAAIDRSVAEQMAQVRKEQSKEQEIAKAQERMIRDLASVGVDDPTSDDAVWILHRAKKIGGFSSDQIRQAHAEFEAWQSELAAKALAKHQGVPQVPAAPGNTLTPPPANATPGATTDANGRKLSLEERWAETQKQVHRNASAQIDAARRAEAAGF